MSGTDFHAMAQAKAARHAALLAALIGQPAALDAGEQEAPAGPAPATPGFDGGVRQTPALPGPTHEQWLAELLQHVRQGGGQRI